MTFNNSLEKVEKELQNSGWTRGSFEQIVSGDVRNNSNSKRLFVLFVYFISFVRVTILLSTRHQSDFWNFFFGNFSKYLGEINDILMFWIAAYTTIMLSLQLVFSYHEYKQRLDILTDFRHLMSTSTTYKLNLRPENIQKLFLHLRLLTKMVPMYEWSFMFSAVPMCAYGVYIEYQVNPSLIPLVLLVFWFCSIFVMIHYIVRSVLMIVITVYLSATYLRMRFEEINSSLAECLMSKSTQNSSRQLIHFIQEHKKISAMVMRHNQTMKWIIFCVHYLFSGVTFLHVSHSLIQSLLFCRLRQSAATCWLMGSLSIPYLNTGS